MAQRSGVVLVNAPQPPAGPPLMDDGGFAEAGLLSSRSLDLRR